MPDALLGPAKEEGGELLLPLTVQTPSPFFSPIRHSPSCIPQDIPAVEGEDAGTGSQRSPAAREKGFPVSEEHFILVGGWRRKGEGAS